MPIKEAPRALGPSHIGLGRASANNYYCGRPLKGASSPPPRPQPRVAKAKSQKETPSQLAKKLPPALGCSEFGGRHGPSPPQAYRESTSAYREGLIVNAGKTRTRVNLVHDCLPHEARNADAVTTAPKDDREGTLVVASDGELFFVPSPHVLFAPRDALWAHDLSIRGKRLVQLPDAGSQPRRAAAPHGPQFLLLLLKEDEGESYHHRKHQKYLQKRFPGKNIRSAVSFI